MFKNLGFSFKTVKIFCQYLADQKLGTGQHLCLKKKIQVKKFGLSHAPILTLFLKVFKIKKIKRKKPYVHKFICFYSH